MRLVLLALLLLPFSAGAAGARGNDHGGGGGSHDVRVTGDCGRGATSSLRLRLHDDGIEVRFRLRERKDAGCGG